MRPAGGPAAIAANLSPLLGFRHCRARAGAPARVVHAVATVTAVAVESAARMAVLPGLLPPLLPEPVPSLPPQPPLQWILGVQPGPCLPARAGTGAGRPPLRRRRRRFRCLLLPPPLPVPGPEPPGLPPPGGIPVLPLPGDRLLRPRPQFPLLFLPPQCRQPAAPTVSPSPLSGFLRACPHGPPTTRTQPGALPVLPWIARPAAAGVAAAIAVFPGRWAWAAAARTPPAVGIPKAHHRRR